MTQRGPFPSSIAPFDGGDFRVRVGLRRLDPAEWLEVEGARAAQLALKEALYEERYPDVVVALDDPEVEAAALELHEMIDSALRSRWGVSAVPVGDGVHPIAAVGLSTQEDWCLLTHAGAPASSGAPQAAPVLGCASVCFPTRWTLTEKLGLTVGEIHGPVPEYATQAGDAVDRFIERLTADRPAWRVNWNLCDDSALHQPYVGSSGRARSLTPDEVGEQVWLRLERQTLRRLPRSGAVAFGIRVHHQPLIETAAAPELLARLRVSLAALPPDVIAYKGLVAHAAAIDQWCGEQLAAVADADQL